MRKKSNDLCISKYLRSNVAIDLKSVLIDYRVMRYKLKQTKLNIKALTKIENVSSVRDSRIPFSTLLQIVFISGVHLVNINQGNHQIQLAIYKETYLVLLKTETEDLLSVSQESLKARQMDKFPAAQSQHCLN
jgi:hypothetical protein